MIVRVGRDAPIHVNDRTLVDDLRGWLLLLRLILGEPRSTLIAVVALVSRTHQRRNGSVLGPMVRMVTVLPSSLVKIGTVKGFLVIIVTVSTGIVKGQLFIGRGCGHHQTAKVQGQTSSLLLGGRLHGKKGRSRRSSKLIVLRIALKRRRLSERMRRQNKG